MTSPPDTPTWCTSCQVHRATQGRPVCPVCRDERSRSEARPS